MKNKLKKGETIWKRSFSDRRFKRGKLEKFMGWMQSEEGMSVRNQQSTRKTIGAVKPDKSGVKFKVFVHNMEKMK